MTRATLIELVIEFLILKIWSSMYVTCFTHSGNCDYFPSKFTLELRIISHCSTYNLFVFQLFHYLLKLKNIYNS